MKTQRNKFLSIRVSDEELKTIIKNKIGMSKTRSNLVRKILLNLPQDKNDKILIKNKTISITKKGNIL